MFLASGNGGGVFSCTSIKNYQSLTADNFFICATGLGTSYEYHTSSSHSKYTSLEKSYNSNTGELTISGLSNDADVAQGGVVVL